LFPVFWFLVEPQVPWHGPGVIPGKLAIASATRNPGDAKSSGFPLAAGMTENKLAYSKKFSGTDSIWKTEVVAL
jgi:hypothetical protein